MKRTLSLILSAIMILAAIPFSVSAGGVTDDGLAYSIENGSVTIAGYRGDAAEVTIPSSIEGYPVVAIAIRAFEYCSELQYINIPDSVVSIGMSAFALSGLIEITIPESVCEISGYTFQNCRYLMKVDLHDGISKIGYCAFEGCKNLTSIELPSQLEEIGGQAFRMTGIKSVVIPDGVKTIGSSSFSSCEALETVVIPDTGTIIYDYAFSGCNNLREVELPEECKLSAGVFMYCQSLESISVPGNNGYILYDCFFKCSSLKDVYIAYGVKNINNSAFDYCNNITSLELPRSIEKLGTSITTPRKKLETVIYHGTEKQWNHLVEGIETDLSEKVQILGIYGDFDGDKEITAIDALYMRKFLAKVTTGEFVNALTGDMNDDGRVNLKDQLIIRKMLAE